MILLISALWLSMMMWAGHPVDTGELDKSRADASVKLNAPQDAMAVFAASLTKYYVGVARRGPNWTAAATDDLDEVTKANRVYLADLVAAKKLVGAGRVLEGEGWAWLL